MVDTGLSKSRSEARRLIQQGGVSVNDEKVTDFARVFTLADLDADGALIIKKGKKGYHQIKTN
jgi:tyrosyl-tRNA synthetase